MRILQGKINDLKMHSKAHFNSCDQLRPTKIALSSNAIPADLKTPTKLNSPETITPSNCLKELLHGHTIRYR